MTPYCQDFQDYLDPTKYLTEDGKKQPPPCSACAEAAATRRRAADLRRTADKYEAGADARIQAKHQTREAL